MILIFDYFETIVHNKSRDFNRGLKDLWEKYPKSKESHIKKREAGFLPLLPKTLYETVFIFSAYLKFPARSIIKDCPGNMIIRNISLRGP